MTTPRDELATRELTGRARVAIAGVAVLAVAVVAIATLRPDRQGVGTPIGGVSPSASPSPSPSESPPPSESPIPAQSPAPAPEPPPLTVKTGARLVVEEGTQLRILDVDSGRLTVLPRFPDAKAYDRLDVLVVGRQLAMVGDNNTGAGSGPFPAYVTTAGPGSRLREVGQASSLLPSEHPGRVWLVADNDTNDPDWGTTLTEVDMRGAVHVRKKFVHTFGVRPFGGGFLREVGDADQDPRDMELIDMSGHRLRLFTGMDRVAVTGRTAVLAQRAPCVDGCNVSVLSSGTSVTERRLKVDDPPTGGNAVLSPEGQALYLLSDQGNGGGTALAEMLLVDGGIVRIDDARADHNFGPALQFSSDGRWMFFVDADRTHIDAFDRVNRTSYRAKGTFGRFMHITALP
ncbi:MAG: hypothetical protein QOE05_998 [Actinomycetota bacterium]|nr:hypothetical protein [Actinomycetota bacterium]